MSRRTIEVLRGTGTVLLKGKPVVEKVPYIIRVEQNIIETPLLRGGVARTPGMKDTAGMVDVSELPGLPLFNLVGKDVELILEDGRRWPCYVESPTGELLARGAIKEPDAS